MEPNRKQTTSGHSLTVFNDKSSSFDGEISYKQKFVQAVGSLNKEAVEFADDSELFYFGRFHNKVKDLPDYGWSSLSKQERTVINGLKVIAYLGYRESFAAGIKRGYEDKPFLHY